MKPINLETGEIRQFSEEDVWNALRECYDPEIPVNIVDLGLVYDVEINGSSIAVTMTLTAPGCGMAPVIAEDVKMRLVQIQGVKEAKVNVVFTPIWNQSMMSEAARRTLGI
ncbi:MAG: iron-sulfur cluster assembly protein [Bacteroidota bacterium]